MRLERAIDGMIVVRFTYEQACDEPAMVAAAVGELLRRRGWSPMAPAARGQGLHLGFPSPKGGDMHNPLRSEAEAFRLVVIFVAAAAVVIAVALIVDPLAGAIVLAVELVAGLWLALRGSRGTLPHTAEVAHTDDGVHRILVVANETVGGKALLEEIGRRSPDGKTEVMVVVPALTASALEHWSSDVDGALADARQRLDASLATMRAAGISARGQVGDHHEPAAAIEDALREFPADELVISTHPPSRSRWLESGVVERARSDVPLPVTHVIVDLEAETAVVDSAGPG